MRGYHLAIVSPRRGDEYNYSGTETVINTGEEGGGSGELINYRTTCTWHGTTATVLEMLVIDAQPSAKGSFR